VALSMTGVAVAHWSDEIYFEGTVKTGSVTVGWASVAAWENGELGGKDVGSIDAWLKDEETDPRTAETVYHTLVIEISNVYPGWMGHIDAVIKNAGSIPVDLVDVTIDGGLPPENEVDICFVYDWLESLRLDPDSSATIRADILVKEDAPEGTTYTFSITRVFNQWG
ncbi:unnamed protein product, partial [marine sediment metagenome]